MKSKYIIVILFSLSIFLLFLNLAIDKFSIKEGSRTLKEISTDEIDSLFLSILKEYSIGTGNIKKIKSPFKKADSLIKSYLITLPKDLPIPVILRDIFSHIKKWDVELKSVEKEINRHSILEIHSGENIKLYAEFKMDRNLLRENSSISFILTDTEKLSENELNELLDYPEYLTLVLIPSQKNKDLANKISTSYKEVIVAINDRIEDPEFKFEKDFSQARLRLSTKLLIGAFNQNKFFLIDDTSPIYSSKNFQFLKKEFLSRGGYNLIPVSYLNKIERETGEKTVEQFILSTKKLGKKETVFILCSVKNFFSLLPEVQRLRKSGIKIVPLSSSLTGFSQ